MATALNLTRTEKNNTANVQFPHMIEAPAGSGNLSNLLAYVENNRTELDSIIARAGAIVFRGYEIYEPKDFESLALSFAPDLKDEYLGTSPRNPVPSTQYVFSASELPPHYPIMQHCEMSFLPNPPKNLFFYCHEAPQSGGETPLCDFRNVVRDLQPEVLEKFREKGIRTVRNYSGPGTKGGLTLWQLKRWDEMFNTTDPKVVEAKCEEQGLEYYWKPGNKLCLVNTQPATTKHPESGEEVWFNHLQVFHREAAAIEYAFIRRRQRNLRSAAVSGLVSVLTWLKRINTSSEDLPMHCTFADGTEIPNAFILHLERVIWQNMAFVKWQKGDVVAIDNFSTSHGRMPYSGPRNIMVAWA